jgi:hypothetical protein
VTGKCEAVATHGLHPSKGRPCLFNASYVRDGRHVCYVHKRAASVRWHCAARKGAEENGR